MPSIATPPASTPAHAGPRRAAWLAPATWLLACLAGLPLLANPGYFHIDEYAWQHIADPQSGYVARALDWGAIEKPQYRPLTFHLWVLLSRALFATPPLMHAAFVAGTALVAMLLALVLRAAGTTPRVALAAAVVFALHPYVAFTTGWVGTLADLLWVAALLLLLRAALSRLPPAGVAVASVALTGLALLAKEAAVSIPAILACGLVLNPRDRRWHAATWPGALLVLLYLVLRWPALTAARPGAHYAIVPGAMPAQWLDYQLYPLLPNAADMTALPAALAPAWPLAFAVALLAWLGLGAMLWRAGRRYLWLWLAAGIAALLPVLPIAGPISGRYGYGFAAVGVGVLAMAWARLPRAGRVLALACLLPMLAHTVATWQAMQRIGRWQAHYMPAIAAALRRSPDGEVRLHLAPGARRAWWMTEVTFVERRQVRGHVHFVAADAPADYTVAADGALLPTAH
jgi:hypothetical protein